MKFFIASHDQELAKGLALKLIDIGHTITSRWVFEDKKFAQGLKAYTDQELKRLALIDEKDVRAAKDGLILISSTPGIHVPGGKHVESGLALAKRVPIYVIGHKENIFHWHHGVSQFQTEEEFLQYLSDITTKPISYEKGQLLLKTLTDYSETENGQ